MLARNREIEVDLVLAGPMGWLYKELLEEIQSEPYCPRTGHPAGTLPDAELAILIKKSSLVTIPSLYEGLCLPMVEAMACGAPTVTAAPHVLPEVSGVRCGILIRSPWMPWLRAWKRCLRTPCCKEIFPSRAGAST